MLKDFKILMVDDLEELAMILNHNVDFVTGKSREGSYNSNTGN